MTPPVTPLHMGALHPVEQLLTVLLAFGPFLLLAAVVVVRRRQDRAGSAREQAPGEPARDEQVQRDR
ncbi:hypothetical protein ACT8ZV_13105 [Nocardioides sp. MAHUQ-72]|uniref:hypothetical protein n=1 Tax=unclassified Nocardioides TaxID=2615069 RepID=UPI003616F4A1